jgi:predicted peptidase
MNRYFSTTIPLLLTIFQLTMAAKPLPAADDHRDRFEPRTFVAGDFSLPYRLLKPKNYDPRQKYPLVIFLHGAGERGNDNEKQLIHGMNDFASDEVMEKYPAFVMAPQCPAGQQWGGINRLAKVETPEGQLPPALDATLKAAKAMEKDFSIDDRRIYLTGLSMGGYGSWKALETHPDMFAAAAIICGGGKPEAAAKFKHVPIWVFHGADDKTVPVEQSREMVEALKAAGANPKYTEYPGVGHNSWAATYSNPELYAWLFAQKKQ